MGPFIPACLITYASGSTETTDLLSFWWLISGFDRLELGVVCTTAFFFRLDLLSLLSCPVLCKPDAFFSTVDGWCALPLFAETACHSGSFAAFCVLPSSSLSLALSSEASVAILEVTSFLLWLPSALALEGVSSNGRGSDRSCTAPSTCTGVLFSKTCVKDLTASLELLAALSASAWKGECPSGADDLQQKRTFASHGDRSFRLILHEY